MPRTSNKKKKNPAAVALGRLGGLKGGIRNLPKKERKAIAKQGGVARAKGMTAKERSESGRKAALARWAKHGSK